MATTSVKSAAELLEELDGIWEIYEGNLRERPPMSFGHNEAQSELVEQLLRQVSSREYRVRQNSGHLLIPNGDSYVPDVMLVPVGLIARFRQDRARFERYSEPLPFVVEVWSPSTGKYDIDSKIPRYQERGDAEIWRVHSFDKTVRIWRLRPDGGYVESIERTGVIALHELPSVRIDLDELFRE